MTGKKEKREHTTYPVGPLSYPRMKEIMEGLWKDVAGAQGRKALRESLELDYLSRQNVMMHPDRNAQLIYRVARAWSDAREALVEVNPNEWHLHFNSQKRGNMLQSKKLFEYPSFGGRLQVSAYDDPTWSHIYYGGEITGELRGGLASFLFEPAATRVETNIEARPLHYNPGNLPGIRIDVSNVLDDLFAPSFNPAGAEHSYTVKVNKQSVEYWVDDELVGIIQFGTEADNYSIRAVAPYVLYQISGMCPSQLPWFSEYVCGANQYLGTNSNHLLKNIFVRDGDPAPSRTLHPYTDDGTGTHVKWEGWAGVDPSLTSDGIPIAGYRYKQVYFLADEAGDLEIYVDYGDNNFDLLTTETVAANTLVSFLTQNDGLWLQLKYIPTAPPANITRARVMMS